LSVENYEQIQTLAWSRLGVDIEAYKMEIVDRWAEEIFVTEHKLRYVLEQKRRLNHTTSLYSLNNFEESRIEFFFECYNDWVNLDIERSHLFRSPKIKGDTSFLEKALEDAGTEPTGVEVLQKDIPENKTFINRLMNWIHA